MADDTYDVLIVGGGVAGRSAGIYTARNGLETLILDAGGSILRRNARLENYPGFRRAWTPASCSTRWPSRPSAPGASSGKPR